MYTGAHTSSPYPYLTLGTPAGTPRSDAGRLLAKPAAVDHPLRENCPASKLSYFISLKGPSSNDHRGVLAAFHASFHA